MTAPWHPLTPGQYDFWEEFRAHPGTAVSTVAHLTRFTGSLDAPALAQAITRCSAEAGALALRFRLSGDQPQQSADPAHAPVLWQHDLRDRPDPQAAARALMQADIDRPLDLLAGPIAAQWLLRVGGDDWLWYCRGHHITLDGYAMALIERRVAQIYAHLTQGADPGQPFAPFDDHLTEDAALRASPRYAESGRFWADYLAAGPEPAVLRKGSENYPAAPRCAECDLADLAEALPRAADRLGLGWVDLLTLLAGLWLWDNPDQPGGTARADRLVWIPFQSRMGSVSARIPAMAVNILPFRIAPDPQAGLPAQLAALAGDLRRLRRHGRYRIEQMTTDRGLGAGHRFFFSPLINVMPFDPPDFPGCQTMREVLAAGPGDGFNLSFSADSRGAGLSLVIEADPALTPAPLFDHHARGLPDFLRRSLAALQAG